jgi:PncC family amidohydrolase
METQKIEVRLGELLREKRVFICTAESCTGGLLAHRITDVAGSSDYFLGSMVTYSNQAKIKWLGVNKSTLNTFGAVSEQTVKEMALGILAKLPNGFDKQKTIALAVSGIAGPSGGTKEKPVGTVWMCWQLGDEILTRKFHLHGTREEIKSQSAEMAMMRAARMVEGL